jgi:hypothetical protein
VLPPNDESPLYLAVIECVPADRIEIVKVAMPELRFAVPRVEVPSKKVTVPVGIPEPGATALTVAVNVTPSPKTDGFSDDVTVVELLALLTVWLKADDVLPLKVESPL